MKFFLPETRFTRTCVTALFAALLLTIGLQAQTKKKTTPTPSKKTAAKTVAKKTTTTAKDAKKSGRKETVAKKSTKADPKKATAKSKRDVAREAKTSKNSKQTAKDDAKDRNSKKPDKKQSAKDRRAEAARRAAEEKRRIAAIEAERRRQEAIRIARERRLAFERGLKNQTAENILNDNTEGEDLTIRQAAVNALGTHAGTVVVMEAKTGKVVTMVNQDWAIKNSFKPCSTIKLVTAVGGISEGVINEEGGIGTSTSGPNLDSAIARSMNPYFQRTGVNFGNEKMISYAKTLGLGERTGINADGETPGKLPFGNKNPRIYSHGDDFEVTPLQLAVMVSAIANDGKKVVPQIVKPSQQKASFKPKFHGEINVPYRTVQGVLPGMIGAAEWGTAHRGIEQGMGVAGKTGSCIFKGTWIGLFASVAPVEDPQYSVVVIMRGESERGKYAAAVAGNVYRALAPRLRRNQEKYVALKSLHPSNSDSLAATGDDEEDDDAAMDSNTSRGVIVAGAAAKRADEPKKLIQKTTQSKPTNKPTNFAPIVIQFDKEKAAKTRDRVVKN
ncbi:MAG: penicillin-binding transpeptidase domain-containing protein [Pyrinomonadaceae bacterium]